MNTIFDFEWLMSSLRLSLPLLFAAMGGVVCERSGVVNIALEGFMVVGALAGAVVVVATGSQPLGLTGAIVAGAGAAGIYAVFVIHGRAQQVVAGAAFNMLIIGVAPFVTKALYGISGGTPALDVATENQDFARVLMAIVTCASLFSPFAIWWILERTRPGLLLRFAGEEPGALESAGVSPRIVRTAAVVASGALAALGGATLSVLLSSSFARGMTGGRGFMALAAVIFAGWRPIPAAVVCLVFAGADAAQIRLQGSEHTLMGLEVPVQLIQALPYLLTFIAVALRSGVTNVPRYLGRDV
ncbi:MAG: ABC transporter permease [Proteobacteria bacterium]|jgi:ABC-type uncharacterized transport system permease subunit|nr:ABC transporter permease [Pseudomonadota bacterium]